MERLKDLNALFLHQMRDLYNAEKQLEKALPEMAKKASNNKLKTIFNDHLEETKTQISRLETAFEKLEQSPKGETCKAMQGLIKEAEDMMQHKADNDVMDAALIAEAQRVEHYEIAGYGTVCTYARQLGYDQIYDLLQENLREEKNADKKLTYLAEEKVNVSAEA